MKLSTINWSYHGPTDLSCGTDATTTEKTLGYLGGFIGFGLYIYFFLMKTYSWAYWQYFVGSILAFDVAGGLVCNSLNSCKRFYSTPLKPDEKTLLIRLLKLHWFFTLIHIHPFILQICFGSPQFRFYGLFWYFILQLSAHIVLLIPLYLQRPTAMLVCLLVLILNYYIIPPIDGFQWFIPALFIKIIYGHLVQEEPYRPNI
ncbi:hypothetical protein I4U23_011819 [Adineta vaga]|nr:hypothetical protein I4U23_011819 [Adineta vaga]